MSEKSEFSTKFGNAPTIQPRDPTLIAEAEFQEWAPLPCVCNKPCISTFQQQRMYARVYDSKYEINMPIAPLGCCTVNENCIHDWTTVMYFDRQPVRSPMCCFCIPLNCCGPPVIFTKHPKCCCCIDFTPCIGEALMVSPCSCCNLKAYLCCGEPCYVTCALPMLGGVKNGDEFLGKWKGAVEDYKEKHPHLKDQLAIFQSVKDDIGPLGSAVEIERK